MSIALASNQFHCAISYIQTVHLGYYCYVYAILTEICEHIQVSSVTVCRKEVAIYKCAFNLSVV